MDNSAAAAEPAADFPEDFNFEGNLIELTPENELNFIESDPSNPQIHSGSSVLSQANFVIKNVFDGPVLFKIQTTSPLHYRVKPSHGRIEQGEVKEVNITMSSDSKKADKFLINVVPTFQSSDSTLDFNSQFKLVPENFIQKYRLKCVMTGGSSGAGSGLLAATGAGSGSVGSISSPVAPSLLRGGDSMTSVTSAVNGDVTGGGPTAAAATNATLISPNNTSTASTSPSLSSASTGTLQRELRDARAEIERLKSLKLNQNAVAQEWKNVLSAQYGVPPVLVLLVAIFAFMVGLLF